VHKIIRLRSWAVIGMIGLLLAGCGDRVNLEDASLPLALGLDLDENDKFHFFISAPIFSKDIKKKTREVSGKAESLRQSRAKQDSQLPGAVQGRNYQVILVGERMLRHNGWFRTLDVIFRDTRNTVSDRVIMVDGAVAPVIYLEAPDQPSVPVFLRGLVDSSAARGESVKTTALDLHRQFYEQGMTPFISQIGLEKGKITMKGTALLGKGGKYATSLGFQETVLLLLLRGEVEEGMSLSYKLPGMEVTGPFATDVLSISLGKSGAKIKTAWREGEFHFQISVKAKVSISEELFRHDNWSNDLKLTGTIEELVQRDIEKLLAKFQQHRVDPVGFGIHARAFAYPHFKQVQEHWAEELARATFDVSVKLQIESSGPIK